jgi:hypothetical protein
MNITAIVDNSTYGVPSTIDRPKWAKNMVEMTHNTIIVFKVSDINLR